MFEQELARQLRLAQRERDGYKKAIALHKAPPTLDTVAKKPAGYSVIKNSKNPHDWIKGIEELISARGDSNHVIGTLLDDKKVAICTSTEEKSLQSKYKEMSDVTLKAIGAIKLQKMEKAKEQKDKEYVSKLQQENLNLKTNLEMISYDLAEFDELSLEAQMLREAQFRTEKRLQDDDAEIEGLRAEKNNLEREMVMVSKKFAEEMEAVYAESLKKAASFDNQQHIVDELKEDLLEARESLATSRDENRHLSER